MANNKLIDFDKEKEQMETPTTDAPQETQETVSGAPEEAGGIVDLDFSPIRKKRFRIDGDDDRILELNTSDMNIVTRLSEADPKLKEIQTTVAQLQATLDETTKDDTEQADGEGEKSTRSIAKVAVKLRKADEEMRKLLDYIFDAPVSEVCSPSGNMYDPIGGEFRYEHIMNILINLYEDNLREETKKISARAQKYTSKYHK